MPVRLLYDARITYIEGSFPYLSLLFTDKPRPRDELRMTPIMSGTIFGARCG